MGISSFFKKKETDLLNYAHSVREGALSLFDEVVSDLHHAHDVYEHVKETALADKAILEQDFKQAVAQVEDRLNTASDAQTKVANAAAKIEALFS